MVMRRLAFVLDQNFEEIGQASLDEKKRVTLKKAIDVLRQNFGSAVESKVSFVVSCNSPGQILLSPETTVPLHEAWLYKNKKALASVQRGLEQARRGERETIGSFAQYADDEIE